MPLSAHDIAAELRAQRPGLPVKKLHKLLYYCQAHHLSVHGQPLFDEAIEAWKMGPVVAELWRVEKYGDPLPPRQELGQAELNTVGYTLSRYGNLTGTDLERLSHNEDPWLRATRDRGAGGNVVIEHEWITEYFRRNDGDGEDGVLDRELVAQWLDRTATRPVEPGRALTREELAAVFEADEARLGG